MISSSLLSNDFNYLAGPGQTKYKIVETFRARGEYRKDIVYTVSVDILNTLELSGVSTV